MSSITAPRLTLEMEAPLPVWSAKPLLDLVARLASENGYELTGSQVEVTIMLSPVPLKGVADAEGLRSALREQGVLSDGSLHVDG